MFPHVASTYDWGNIDKHKFESCQLANIKKTCQQHCFSNPIHNFAYCYNEGVILLLSIKVHPKGLSGASDSFVRADMELLAKAVALLAVIAILVVLITPAPDELPGLPHKHGPPTGGTLPQAQTPLSVC